MSSSQGHLAGQRLRRVIGRVLPDDGPSPAAEQRQASEWLAEPVETTPPITGEGQREPGETARRWSPRAFTTTHLAALALALVVAVIAGVTLTLRSRTSEVPLTLTSAATAPSGAQATSAASSGSPSAPSSAPATIQVHVAGAVRRPGVVTLPAGARVHDALEAAGGATSGADLTGLNLAAVVADGSQVLVGVRGSASSTVRADQAQPPATAANPSGGAGSTAPINLNTATAAQLETLPGVGPVTAANIIRWRDEHGRFSRVEELQEVDGIGPKTYARLAPHVTV